MRWLINVVRVLATIVRWRCYIWLPGYLRQSMRRQCPSDTNDRPIDIIFLVVDHFEPSRREAEEGIRKVQDWCESYAQVATRHRDSDGVMPQHTWFYRYDYPNYACIRILSEYVYRHFGEVEFHLHHGHDTAETFTHKIRDGVDWFNQAGAMISAEEAPTCRFAYIAGNWALDNGQRNPAMSGVNTELEILGRAGCYADFTFPAFGESSQPRMANTIYYATDTPAPKSYDKGVPVEVGKPAQGDLMIFPGPLHIDWRNGYIEYAAFEFFAPYFRRRLDSWLSAGIHVTGQPHWIFVKLHTHGMQSRETFLGPQLDQMHTDLEHAFMRDSYRLHYVTAREAYNIVRAAEAGKTGNPNDYRDYEVLPPANRLIACNTPYRLDEYSTRRVRLHLDNASHDVVIRFATLPLCSMEGGQITRVDFQHEDGRIKYVEVLGKGSCCIHLIRSVAGAGREVEEVMVRLPYKYGDLTEAKPDMATP
jgi:hypothetical protein